VQTTEVMEHGGMEVAMVVFPRLLAELPVAFLFTAMFFIILILMTINTQVI
jgi:hypothetical protein